MKSAIDAAIPVFLSYQHHTESEMDDRIAAYPGQPRAALGTKSQLPRWLKRLKELIGLKEGGDPKGIDQSDDDDVS